MSGNTLRLKPRVDERRCTTCGDCLRACPTGCLTVVGYVPVVTLERACIGCGVCPVVCPAAAIDMVLPMR